MRVAVPVAESLSTRLSEVLCLGEADERCPSHYLGLRQATALRPDRLIVPAGDNQSHGRFNARSPSGRWSSFCRLAAAALPLERPPGVCR